MARRGFYGGAFVTKDAATGRETVEETFTCPHCNGVALMRPAPTEMNGFCMRCHGPICFACAKDGRCIPFVAKVEAMEGRRRELLRLLERP